MCIRTNTPPALVCTIGDTVPGTRYHDPNGDTFMVLDLPRSADSTTVVNLRSGKITPVYSSTKLGYDHKGRLYASTFLNGWYAPVDEDAATTWLPPGGYTPDDLADEVVDLSVPPAPPKAPPVEDDDEGIDLGAFDIGGEG